MNSKFGSFLSTAQSAFASVSQQASATFNTVTQQASSTLINMTAEQDALVGKILTVGHRTVKVESKISEGITTSIVSDYSC